MLVEPARVALIETGGDSLGEFVVLNYDFIEQQPTTGYKELFFPVWYGSTAGLGTGYRQQKKNAITFYQVWGT